MKNIWTFGDSFTNYTYGDDITQWSDIVAKELNIKIENFGKIGYSNQQIISSILENIWKIEEGDYVVIGLSAPTRTIMVKNGKIKSFLPYDYINSESDIEKSAYGYVSNILLPNRELINEFYWNQIKGVEKLLNRLDCKTFLWDSSLWDLFETIRIETKGKDKNPHWSKKGNEDMSRLVIENLTKHKKGLI